MKYEKSKIKRISAISLAVAIVGGATAPVAVAAPEGEVSNSQKSQGNVNSKSSLEKIKTANGGTTGGKIAEETDRLVVKMKDDNKNSEKEVEKVLEEENLTEFENQDVETVEKIATDEIIVETDETLDNQTQEDLAEKIEENPNVEYAEPDYIIENAASFIPNDTFYSGSQWNLRNMNLPSAWDSAKGEGTVIGIGDTGSTNHEDLSSKQLKGYDFVHPDFSRDGGGYDSNPQDQGTWGNSNSNWHGSHVAGIAAASTNNGKGVAGVSPGAAIQHSRLLGTNTNGYQSDIANGVLWAGGVSVAGVPKNQTPADVVNLSMSWASTTCPSSMKNAIDKLHAKNIPVVVAAGNTSSFTGNASPSNCLGAIVVGATNSSNNLSWYSNWGWHTDVVAPGGDSSASIYSTIDKGLAGPVGSGYGNMNGTSMATPHVAGVVSLMKEKNPYLTVEQIRETLVNSGTNAAGYKKVDAKAALAATADRRGAIGKRFAKEGGTAKWGVAQGVETKTHSNGAFRNYYNQKNNSVVTFYNSPKTGTKIVERSGEVGKKFFAGGGHDKYGYPTTDLVRTSTVNGVSSGYQDFLNPKTGVKTRISWTPTAGTKVTNLSNNNTAKPAMNKSFKDVNKNTAHYESIMWMAENGYSNGWSDGTFRPTEAVERNAMIAFLYRMEGSPKVNLPAKSPFKDVKPGDPFYKEIIWAKQQGVSTGWSDGTFRPNDKIKRDAMAAFMYRLADEPSVNTSKTSFKDVSKKTQFYKEIEWMKQSGLSTGWSNGTYRPYDNTNRDATAAFLKRFSDKF